MTADTWWWLSWSHINLPHLEVPSVIMAFYSADKTYARDWPACRHSQIVSRPPLARQMACTWPPLIWVILFLTPNIPNSCSALKASVKTFAKEHGKNSEKSAILINLKSNVLRCSYSIIFSTFLIYLLVVEYLVSLSEDSCRHLARERIVKSFYVGTKQCNYRKT